jgi:hypothetical protein
MAIAQMIIPELSVDVLAGDCTVVMGGDVCGTGAGATGAA